jgi:WD40 repeat protein
VAWSPDGKQVLTGGEDNTARIWDVANGQVVRTLEGHTVPVGGVAWSPDGKQVLTGSYDTTARIWDVANGQVVRTLEGHTGGVSAVAWSPDGKQVLTGSEDNTAQVWIADEKPIFAELTRRICNTVTEDQIKATIPSWRGCTVELAAVAADLKEYDALRPR